MTCQSIPRYGTIHESSDVDRRYTSTHSTSRRPTLQRKIRLKMTPSEPTTPTAAVAIARLCAEIIFAMTPPVLLAAHRSTASSRDEFASCQESFLA